MNAQKVDQVIELLGAIARDYVPACLANSLGAEDMVLMDLIAKHTPSIEVFSLDTGRLPAETYQLIQKVRERYPLPLRVYFPDAALVEDYINNHGPNAFYDSLELRKRCCQIRKIEPLRRALEGRGAWITGLRREQAVTRKDLPVLEWDADNALAKFNPLADWSERDVWAYIRSNNVPYNVLHDRRYPSIGCAPCTQAVTAGEDIRAGRWWWENAESKECGLHRHVGIGG